MEKRIKKPSVESEKRQNWLRRSEGGESAPHIAKTDSFDVRTVRKQIALAKQQQEAKEAKAMVLRNALESHYNDLCEYAEKLSTLGHGESAAESPREGYIHSALRQHLPRSPIWNYLKQRGALDQQIYQLRQQASTKIEELVNSDSRLSSEIEAIPGIIPTLRFQLEQWAQVQPGMNTKDSLITEDAGKLVSLRYGNTQICKVKRAHGALLNTVLQDYESSIRQWKEYEQLRKSFAELKRVESNLKEEFAVITLRRIVPGRCRYCPL